MSIFGSIMSKIFGNHGAAAANADAPPASPSAPSAGASTSPPDTSVAASALEQPVDVEGVLIALASKNSDQLNWRTSIVDLMKLLDLDSSLNARKELATELHYTGEMNDSASMNIWLHKQVMQKLAENGGKVPDDLKS
jgi:3-oxoacyl-ACP reductase-like protein